ncbi:hypothetical protein TNCV_3573381 [Trichonephila clavipes]|nr:hypothetical protein TNCV_3573381 [Trichonephila clavipes]
MIDACLMLPWTSPDASLLIGAQFQKQTELVSEDTILFHSVKFKFECARGLANVYSDVQWQGLINTMAFVTLAPVR